MSKTDGLGSGGTPPPGQTAEQRRVNLDKARRRRRLYAELRDGQHDPWAVWLDGLLEPESDWGRLPVRTFLLCLPGVGVRKQERWLVASKVSPKVRLGKLSQHQIDRLAPRVEAALERAGLLPDHP